MGKCSRSRCGKCRTIDRLMLMYIALYLFILYNIILPCSSVRAHVAAIAEHWRGGRYVTVALLFFNISDIL